MFCYEGLWYKVDCIWIMNLDGSECKKMYICIMNMEIVGYEFFDVSGE